MYCLHCEVKRLRRTENVRWTFEGVSAPRELAQPSPLSEHRTPYYRVGSRFVNCASHLRRVLLLCGLDIGGLVLRCPISAIGRLSSSVRRFSLCIRSILADRKTPPRPYDAKCGRSAMLVWRSLAADTIRSMSVTLHCMRHVVLSA